MKTQFSPYRYSTALQGLPLTLVQSQVNCLARQMDKAKTDYEKSLIKLQTELVKLELQRRDKNAALSDCCL